MRGLERIEDALHSSNYVLSLTLGNIAMENASVSDRKQEELLKRGVNKYLEILHMGDELEAR